MIWIFELSLSMLKIGQVTRLPPCLHFNFRIKLSQGQQVNHLKKKKKNKTYNRWTTYVVRRHSIYVILHALDFRQH